jgi:rSAM/selenodomain-associated transferase 2
VIAAPRGRGVQQNSGAKTATGDVFLFLHADNWLSGNVADQMERAFRGSSRLHGAFHQRIDADGLAYRLLERGNAERIRWLGLPYGDQAIFVRRETFFAVGGFPEVPLMEDVLLMQRLRRRSWPLLLSGPVHVSPRRWQQHGVLRQTLRNWTLLVALTAGASPERLARFYRRHDS